MPIYHQRHWFCSRHGRFIALTGVCPNCIGCLPAVITPLNPPAPAKSQSELATEAVLKELAPRWPRKAYPKPSPHAVYDWDVFRERDRRTGRFLPRADDGGPVPPQECMSEPAVRDGLKRLLSHLPTGTKKPLARLCGYRGKWALQTLRGVAKGRAYLLDACRRRISRVLWQVQHGELAFEKTARISPTGRPVYVWTRPRTDDRRPRAL